jgi:hypothetical protein
VDEIIGGRDGIEDYCAKGYEDTLAQHKARRQSTRHGQSYPHDTHPQRRLDTHHVDVTFTVCRPTITQGGPCSWLPAQEPTFSPITYVKAETNKTVVPDHWVGSRGRLDVRAVVNRSTRDYRLKAPKRLYRLGNTGVNTYIGCHAPNS